MKFGRPWSFLISCNKIRQNQDEKKLLLIFNLHLTTNQSVNASSSLGVDSIVDLPEKLKPIWKQIPPNFKKIAIYPKPIKAWPLREAHKGDYVLIQGDFGACYILVNVAFGNGLVPVYSTTKRKVSEVHGANGEVEFIHSFRHIAFRGYEQPTDNSPIVERGKIDNIHT